jgi:hypothetical protein
MKNFSCFVFWGILGFFTTNQIVAQEAAIALPAPDGFVKTELTKDQFYNTGMANLLSMAGFVTGEAVQVIPKRDASQSTQLFILKDEPFAAENPNSATMLALANDELFTPSKKLSPDQYKNYKRGIHRQLDMLAKRASQLPMTMAGQITETENRLSFILKMSLPDPENSQNQTDVYQSFNFLYMENRVMFLTLISGADSYEINRELSDDWCRKVFVNEPAKEIVPEKRIARGDPVSDELLESLESQQQSQRWINYTLIFAVAALLLLYFRHQLFPKHNRADADDNSTGTDL